MKIGTTLRFVNMDTNETLVDTVVVYEDLSSGVKEAGLTNAEGELIIKVIKQKIEAMNVYTHLFHFAGMCTKESYI